MGGMRDLGVEAAPALSLHLPWFPFLLWRRVPRACSALPWPCVFSSVKWILADGFPGLTVLKWGVGEGSLQPTAQEVAGCLPSLAS